MGLTTPISSSACPCIVEYHANQFEDSDDETPEGDTAQAER